MNERKFDDYAATADFLALLKPHLDIKTRRYIISSYSSCFVAKDAVKVAQNHFPDMNTDTIIAMLESARRMGIIHHVEFEQRFINENLFFAFSNDRKPNECGKLKNVINIVDNEFHYTIESSLEIALALESYTSLAFELFLSEDGLHFNYEEYRTSELYCNEFSEIQDKVQNVDVEELQENEKLAFWINFYNIMCVHAMISVPRPESDLGRFKWFDNVQFLVGGLVLTLNQVENGCLRRNRKAPYHLSSYFSDSDTRKTYMMSHLDNRIHFALVCAARSCPRLRPYTMANIDVELTTAAKDFVARDFRVVYRNEKIDCFEISMIMYWYLGDFGESKIDMIRYIMQFADEETRHATQRGLETNVPVKYIPYDWMTNN